MALWVPVIWIFIVASRLPSQWLGVQRGALATALEEGNSLDRTISLVLILLAIGILMSRSFEWGTFFAHNFALTTFLCFGLLSVLWSDFTFVAFKRWFRDCGNYLVILVALSDPRPLEAVGALLRRLFYLLIPLSVLLIKYYPDMGKEYDTWTGQAMYAGATTSKNMLGVLCLVSGLFFFWDTLTRWRDRKERLTRRIILVNVSFMVMTLWLLNLSSSATSRVCVALGWLVIVAARSKTAKHYPAILQWLILVGVCLYLVLEFGLGIDINAVVAGTVGRDATLTNRTFIWEVLLNMNTNPLVGTGYESFWLGSRLLRVWQASFQGLNEAHNGYLQVYLNLGLIGVFLLAWVLISGYRTICRRLDSPCNLGSLSLTLWTVLIFYNVTEAALGGGLIWLALLPGVIILPPGRERPRDGYGTRPTEDMNSLFYQRLRSLKLRDTTLLTGGQKVVSSHAPKFLVSTNDIKIDPNK